MCVCVYGRDREEEVGGGQSESANLKSEKKTEKGEKKAREYAALQCKHILILFFSLDVLLLCLLRC